MNIGSFAQELMHVFAYVPDGQVGASGFASRLACTGSMV